MNIFVCVKQVPDTATKIKLNSDSSGIDSNGVKWILSPYDELAIEEALRLKEKKAGSSVTVVSAGPERVKESIRTALAMGADTGVHIDLNEKADNYLTAKALAALIRSEENVDLIFTGKEAADDGASQVSQLLASFLEWPCPAVVLAIEYADQSIKAKREVEGGAIENIECPLPAVITAQKGLNEPRYASLPNIMKAKKKEIRAVSMADLGVTEADQKIRYKNYTLPAAKAAGKKIEGDAATQAKELVKLLREVAKVI